MSSSLYTLSFPVAPSLLHPSVLPLLLSPLLLPSPEVTPSTFPLPLPTPPLFVPFLPSHPTLNHETAWQRGIAPWWMGDVSRKHWPRLYLAPLALHWDRPYGCVQLRPRLRWQHAAEPCVVPQCVQCVSAQAVKEGRKEEGREGVREGGGKKAAGVEARFSLW